MGIVLLGQNHRTAPIELRERLAFDEVKRDRLRDLIAGDDSLREGAVLSTCNRVELYAVAEDPQARRRLEDILADLHGVDRAQFEHTLYWHEDIHALRHLFRVASGLDSMVLGEGQILGQVRDAGQWAREESLAYEVLAKAFDAAVSCGKRVRTGTNVGEGSVSVASASVTLARKIFADLAGATVLLLGAGDTGTRVARHLQLFGVRDLRVSNRTRHRAEQLAEELDASVIPWNHLGEQLPQASIVVGAVASSEPVLLAEQISGLNKQRSGRPLFLIDLAVPRCIEPACGKLPGTFLYDVDDLQNIVLRDNDARREEAAKAEEIVDQQLQRFLEWFRGREIMPALHSLRDRLEAIRQNELKSAAQKMDTASYEELDRISRRMLQKMMHEPTVELKRRAARGEGHELLKELQKLFGEEGD